MRVILFRYSAVLGLSLVVVSVTRGLLLRPHGHGSRAFEHDDVYVVGVYVLAYFHIVL